jgi:hypothetical protein
MVAIPTKTGKLPVPRLATAEPGHCPEIPHPNPKITAKIIVIKEM